MKLTRIPKTLLHPAHWRAHGGFVGHKFLVADVSLVALLLQYVRAWFINMLHPYPYDY